MSSSASLYRRYLELVKLWPIDLTKDGRDFGQYLRKRTGIIFSQGELTSVDVNYLEKRIQALERISSDLHRNNNKTIYFASATGLDAATAKQAVSNEALATKTELNAFEQIKAYFGQL